MKDVVVEIERANRKKPFLGGYKHKKTSVEYHHASAQTVQKPRPPPGVERFCRDTQTVKQKHILQQTTNDMATQMTKIGVYINNMRDRLIVPGKYQTADDYRMNTLEKVCDKINPIIRKLDTVCPVVLVNGGEGGGYKWPLT